MITLTPEGRALILRASEAGHVVHRTSLKQGDRVHLTCSCGRLDVEIHISQIVDTSYTHFNEEAAALL